MVVICKHWEPPTLSGGSIAWDQSDHLWARCWQCPCHPSTPGARDSILTLSASVFRKTSKNHGLLQGIVSQPGLLQIHIHWLLWSKPPWTAPLKHTPRLASIASQLLWPAISSDFPSRFYPKNQWIGFRETLNRKPSIFPFFIWGFSCKFPLNQSIETEWNPPTHRFSPAKARCEKIHKAFGTRSSWPSSWSSPQS